MLLELELEVWRRLLATDEFVFGALVSIWGSKWDRIKVNLFVSSQLSWNMSVSAITLFSAENRKGTVAPFADGFVNTVNTTQSTQQ